MSTHGLPWFRFYSEAVDDEKLRLLAFEDRWHYVALLCCKSAGLLDSGDDEALLHRKVGVKLGLQTRDLDAMSIRLAELGLIDARTFQPTAWDERQFHSDNSTARVQAYRARMKQERNVSVTAQDTDTDTDTDKSKSKSKCATAPTLSLNGEPPPAKPKAKAQKRPTAVLPTPPAWVNPLAWKGFVDMRRRHFPLTQRAAELVILQLEKLRAVGHDPNDVLDQSTRQSWRDVYAIRQERSNGTGDKESLAQRVERKSFDEERRARAIRQFDAELVGEDGGPLSPPLDGNPRGILR